MKRINCLGLFKNSFINLNYKNINGIIKIKPITITKIITAQSSSNFNNQIRFFSSGNNGSPLKFLNESSNGNENYEYFKSIQKKNDTEMDTKFYQNILNDFFNLKQYDQAIKIYEEICKNKDIKFDKQIITRMMKAYAEANNMEKCLELYNENQNNFDIIMGQVIIKGYLDQSNFEEAMKWFEKCDQLNLIDIGVFSTIIGKLSKSGQFGIIDMMLNQIKNKNLNLDAKLYTSLFNGLQNYTGSGHVERTFRFYQQLMSKDSNVKMDTKLFKTIAECLYYKKQYKTVIELYDQFKYDSSIEFSFALPKILSSFNFHLPNSPTDILLLWSSIKNPKPSHYSCYFHFLNNSNEYNYFKNYKFNIPEIIEIQLNNNKNNINNNNNNIFQNDIFIVNQIIRYHIIDNDFTKAWSIFQYTLSKSIADVFSFFYILKHLSIHSTNPIVYNNLKEILTSSYYINLTKQFSEYKKVIWIPILKRLNSSEELKPQLKQIITLLEKHTSESLSFYNKVLGDK
ncbi:hypothetical protein ACTFIU_010077 [Dictyostelium citrinum]